jgi:hypothetical protein
MSFVNTDERNWRQRLKNPTKQAATSGDSFRRHQQEVQLPRFDLLQDFFSKPFGLVEVKTGCPNELG